MKYYSLDRLKALDCDYNFIVSGRGPGKSTAICNMLTDARKDGGEFVRIARYDWECPKTLMGQWFNEINQKHAIDTLGGTCTYSTGKWHIQKDDMEFGFGYLVTLNNQDTFKSVSYDRVTNIVYEEFAMMNERDYMVGEVDAFLSAVSTIVRRRQNVKVWFIGNTLSKHNPYFEYFGIDIDRMGIHPGDCRKFRCAGFGGHGATIGFEFADMAESDYMELSPLMRIGGNVTATTGLYDIPDSVKCFEQRTAGLPDDSLFKVYPSVAGAYLGHGEFCKVECTKKPMFDNMKMMVLRKIPVDYMTAVSNKWLNLSGIFNPTYMIDGVPESERVLDCISPYTLYANEKSFRKTQIFDRSCVHAYETDDMAFKWRNFIDQWGYGEGDM